MFNGNRTIRLSTLPRRGAAIKPARLLACFALAHASGEHGKKSSCANAALNSSYFSLFFTALMPLHHLAVHSVRHGLLFGVWAVSETVGVYAGFGEAVIRECTKLI